MFGAARPRTIRKNSSPRAASSSQIELVSAAQSSSTLSSARLRDTLGIERAGQLDADLEQRLVLPKAGSRSPVELTARRGG